MLDCQAQISKEVVWLMLPHVSLIAAETSFCCCYCCRVYDKGDNNSFNRHMKPRQYKGCQQF